MGARLRAGAHAGRKTDASSKREDRASAAAPIIATIGCAFREVAWVFRRATMHITALTRSEQRNTIAIAIEQVLENVFLPGLYRRLDDEEDARQPILVNSITLFAIVVLTIVGTASVIRRSVRVGILDLSAVLFLCLCIVYLRRTGRHRIPVVTGMSIMTCLYFYLFITGGVNGAGHLWYYTYPLFTLYIMEKRDGTVANQVLFVPTVLFLAVQWTETVPLCDRDFILRFLPSVVCVYLFAYLFETTRLRTFERLNRKKAELESSYRELRSKDDQLKEAYDELEQRIEKRTRELTRSNEALRVEIEERKQSERRRWKLEAELSRAQKMG